MIKRIFILLLLTVFFQTSAFSQLPYYLDFKFVLNESSAGKKAQSALKKQLDEGIKSLNQKEKSLLEEEKKIIRQKKIISQEEYKKKVTELRSKVANLQKERNKILNSIADKRKKARDELLKNLNPIIKEYMVEKQIRMVLDKKELILADENLDITKDIIERLNKKLKSLKIN